MNVIIMGENGVCTHDRKDILESFEQLLLTQVNVGPAVVAVVLTDEGPTHHQDPKSFVKQVLIKALLQLEEE